MSESTGRPEDGTPTLELRGVDKSFGAIQVLYDVSLKVYPGQVTALVGDNGAGKSTLIKAIAGIHAIDGGELLFEGRPVTVSGPRDSAALGIEVVYQDLALADNLDVVQNMFLGRERKRGITLDEVSMEQAARETLTKLSVRTLKSVRQLVSSLSGGQRQTVAIAKAVLWESKIVILDEPTAALGVAQTVRSSIWSDGWPTRATRSCSSRTTWSTSSRSPTGSPRSTWDAWPPTSRSPR